MATRFLVLMLMGVGVSVTDGGGVDHSAFDGLLKQFVRDDGVDYRGLKTEEARLVSYARTLAGVEVSKLGDEERMALFINAYNAFTLSLILEHFKPGFTSINEIPEGKRWKAKRWVVGGRTYSLDEIEHEVLRAEFADARIHAALNCASVGCPDLRAEAFAADRLNTQLDEQFRRFVNAPKHVRVRGGKLWVSSIFDWFAGDFTRDGETVASHIARYAASDLRERIVRLGVGVKIKFLKYDWSLNVAKRTGGGG